MTPNELLQAVCDRFAVLLLEPEKLEGLLKLAMRRYQDKAGSSGSLYLSADDVVNGGVEVPPFFSQLIAVHDSKGNYHKSMINREGMINVTHVNRWSEPPYKVDFVVDINHLPLDSGMLPGESIGLIEQYLYHLIELQNNERLRQANQAAKLPVDAIPQASETQAKLDALETAMEEEHSFLPTISISGWF
ncbi:hypothetical protein [Endozoicomonas lisbonensis]|uniref:Morphogenetic protein n=1 Tax=Endozoicomonas lisbonensis TaxID=3120522 RepID=A0ABV2SP79_9GAMM